MSEPEPIDNLRKDLHEIRALLEKWMERAVATETRVAHLETSCSRGDERELDCRTAVLQRLAALETKVTIAGAVAGSIAAAIVSLFGR